MTFYKHIDIYSINLNSFRTKLGPFVYQGHEIKQFFTVFLSIKTVQYM